MDCFWKQKLHEVILKQLNKYALFSFVDFTIVLKRTAWMRTRLHSFTELKEERGQREGGGGLPCKQIMYSTRQARSDRKFALDPFFFSFAAQFEISNLPWLLFSRDLCSSRWWPCGLDRVGTEWRQTAQDRRPGIPVLGIRLHLSNIHSCTEFPAKKKKKKTNP